MKTTETGKLYIVSTPIGNYHDMSPRGIETLQDVDMIAAEDTRITRILLNKLGIRNQLVSNHKFNENKRLIFFLDQLKDGKNIAIVTDAGTPCISDPGNVLIKEAINEEIPVIGIPGCCAAINALVVSGFDLSSFLFCGFFPRESGEKSRMLYRMRREPQTRTFVFYESPKRILNTIGFLAENNVDCSLCVSNDMTKQHEMTFRGTPEEVKGQLEDKWSEPKGEYVIVVELAKEYMITQAEHIVSPEALLVDEMVKNSFSLRDAMRSVLKKDDNTYSKNQLYAAGLRLKDLFEL